MTAAYPPSPPPDSGDSWSPLDRLVGFELLFQGRLAQETLVQLHGEGTREELDRGGSVILAAAVLRGLLTGDEADALLTDIAPMALTGPPPPLPIAESLDPAAPAPPGSAPADPIGLDVDDEDGRRTERLGPRRTAPRAAAPLSAARPGLPRRSASTSRAYPRRERDTDSEALAWADDAASNEATIPTLDVHPIVEKAFDGDRYEVGEEIELGHLEAKDRRIQRTVIFHLAPERLDSVDRIEFFREARILARCNHPTIPKVHDLGALDGRPFFTTDHRPGRPLTEILPPAGLPEPAETPSPAAMLRAFLRVTSAVSHAHDVGLIHGRLTPSRVVVGTFARVWVTGWEGAVAAADAEEATTRVTGKTPRWDPEDGAHEPSEVRARRALDHRTDVFGVGVLLHWILARDLPEAPRRSWLPFSRPSDGLDAARARGRRLAPELVAITRRALAPDPADRYQEVEELSEDVRRFLDGRSVSVEPDRLVPTLRRLARRRRAAFAIAVALIVAVLGGGAVVTTSVAASSRRSARGAAAAARARDDARRSLEEARDDGAAAADREAGAVRRRHFAEALAKAVWWAGRGDITESLRHFDEADRLARDLESADRIRLLRRRAAIQLRAGRTRGAFDDAGALVALAPDDGDAHLDRFLAARRLPGDDARAAEAAALDRLAALGGVHADLVRIVREVRAAERSLALGSATAAAERVADHAPRLVELERARPDLALVHELAARSRLAAGSPETALPAAVAAASLDAGTAAALVARLEGAGEDVVVPAWTHGASFWMRRLEAGARTTERPAALVGLVAALQAADRQEVALPWAERAIAAARADGDAAVLAQAELQLARARLATGAEVDPDELILSDDASPTLAASRAALAARALAAAGRMDEVERSLDAAIAGASKIERARTVLADLTDALLDDAVPDAVALGALDRALETADDSGAAATAPLERRLRAARLYRSANLGRRSPVDVERLGALVPGTAESILVRLAAARVAPGDADAHVAALRAWAELDLGAASTGSAARRGAAFVVERLRAAGRAEAASRFEVGDPVGELRPVRAWEHAPGPPEGGR